MDYECVMQPSWWLDGVSLFWYAAIIFGVSFAVFGN
jgi:hypothetical protein